MTLALPPHVVGEAEVILSFLTCKQPQSSLDDGDIIHKLLQSRYKQQNQVSITSNSSRTVPTSSGHFHSSNVYLFYLLRQKIETKSQVPDAMDNYHWLVCDTC